MTLNLTRLSRLILGDVLRHLDRGVILIGGPGCVGKSSIAVAMRDDIAPSIGKQISILDLDCYLIERAKRENKTTIVSGYNPAGYELQRANRDIEALVAGKPVTVSPYDKATSTRGPEVVVPPSDIFVVEGVMALAEPIRSFGSVAVFVYADRATLYSNRVARETSLRFDRERIERKFEVLMQDYERFIAPQRAGADIVILVGPGYVVEQMVIGLAGQQADAGDGVSRPPLIGKTLGG